MIAPLLAAVSLLTPCWQPPVAAPVAMPFQAPACQWCPGHRGVEFRTEPGSPVRAVNAGVVTFAGTVVGTRYVVVSHPDGIRATYGMLATVLLTRGDTVRAGAIVGVSTARVYFGLRALDDTPIDPTPFLGVPLGRPRLVPTDGTPGRRSDGPATSAMACAVSGDRVARGP